MLPRRLEYLFIADFKDGTRYRQNQNDCSVVHPLTRSAFYDVAQRLADVRVFTLTNGVREHQVFLEDGHFKTDGRVIVHHYGELTNYRLVYFRRMQVLMESGCAERPIVKAYFIGWQANDLAGKNYKMCIEIQPGSIPVEVRGL